MLLKIRGAPGPTRTEVMQLIDIFRARVVDVSDRSLTIAVTGDAGKVPILADPPCSAAAFLTACACAARASSCGAHRSMHTAAECRADNGA